MIDFCVELDDSTESPALIGEVLGVAGVNIEGLCLTKCKDRLVLHFVVEDEIIAKRVLEEAGVKIKEISEVFVLDKDEKR